MSERGKEFNTAIDMLIENHDITTFLCDACVLLCSESDQRLMKEDTVAGMQHVFYYLLERNREALDMITKKEVQEDDSNNL